MLSSSKQPKEVHQNQIHEDFILVIEQIHIKWIKFFLWNGRYKTKLSASYLLSTFFPVKSNLIKVSIFQDIWIIFDRKLERFNDIAKICCCWMEIGVEVFEICKNERRRVEHSNLNKKIYFE